MMDPRQYPLQQSKYLFTWQLNVCILVTKMSNTQREILYMTSFLQQLDSGLANHLVVANHLVWLACRQQANVPILCDHIGCTISY